MKIKNRSSSYRLIVAYLMAIVAANVTVALWGPRASILNAFLFIGFDLTARDGLHEAWRGRGLFPKMTLLIAAGSLLSWAVNRDAGTIALASFVAFAAAGAADSVTYTLLGERSRMVKMNGSNVAAAAVDSLIFPALAFGMPLLWGIVAGQFIAKTIGGALWSLILKRINP